MVVNGTWKPQPCSHFMLHERGKVRPIDAPHIVDRQVQKVECNQTPELLGLTSPCYVVGILADG